MRDHSIFQDFSQNENLILDDCVSKLGAKRKMRQLLANCCDKLKLLKSAEISHNRHKKLSKIGVELITLFF